MVLKFYWSCKINWEIDLFNRLLAKNIRKFAFFTIFTCICLR